MMTLATPGLMAQPAVSGVTDAHTVENINTSITPHKQATWEHQIAPQLARADQQRQQAAAEAERKRQAEAEAAAEAARLAAIQPVVVASSEVRVSQPVTGNCGSWLAAAGVADTGSAMALINRESGCNPNAVNASSGACGVAQELPCGKSGCSLGDGGCQVRWMNSYVLGRYGSWANALGHSNSSGWY